MKLLLDNLLLLSANLLAVVFCTSHAWRDGAVIVVHAEGHLVVHSAVQLDLSIHQLLAQHIIALVLQVLTCVVLPTGNLIFVEHLHLLLKVLRLSLIKILLLGLLLGLLDVLRQVIDAL